ncbi:MAG TPA: hypothetical protein VGK58_06530 [Lacipirellulaceae bacterium]
MNGLAYVDGNALQLQFPDRAFDPAVVITTLEFKPLLDPRLVAGYLRVTTALPQESKRFLEVLSRLLS